MFPAATSFIPITVALASFVREGGNVFGNYPYWYLGLVPFKYLTGPVVPTVILSLQALFDGLSLFDWSLLLIAFAWAVAALGWGVLARQLSGLKKIGFLVGILYLVLPWHIVSSLALSEVSVVVASALGPWVLLAFARISNIKYQNSNLKLILSKLFLPVSLFAILLLTNTIASIPTILGLLILGFVLYKHPAEGLKKAGIVIFLGGLLTFWWYSPNYWLKILFAPSFGGRSVIGAFWHVVDLTRTLVPIALAFIVVVWKVKPKNNFEKFAFLWLGSFVGLTLVRFAANIHFWMDWTSWFGEIEVGLALVGGMFFSKFLARGPVTSFLHDSAHSNLKSTGILIDNAELRAVGNPSSGATPRGVFYMAIILLVALWFLVYENRNFWMPRKDIESTVELQVASKLQEIVKPNESVFLSGSSAFWLNALVNVRQLRGGADQVGLRPDLAKLVWEVRMGNSGVKTSLDLKNMGITYLVVHEKSSKEYYHDIETPGKFVDSELLYKVYDENGDVIYKVK